MGRPDVSRDPDGEEFQLFLQLLRENGNFWSKVSCPERLSASGPPGYDDVVPFARRVVETFPDRVLWGTDWPHPNMKSHMPDDGKLVDFIPRIAVTPELQKKLLVDNPLRLYWPEGQGPGVRNPGVRVKLPERPDCPDIENYFSGLAITEISNNFTLTPYISNM